MLTELYTGWLCRVGALLIMCVMLTACSVFSRSYRYQEDINTWKAAGKPPLVSCNYPFEIKTPALSQGMEPQAHSSMRSFAQAAAAMQAPVLECGVIGGSDDTPNAVPDSSQIAKMDFRHFGGYVLLHIWHPGVGVAYYYMGGGHYVMNPPPPGSEDKDYYVNPSYSYVDDTARYADRISTAYGAWYLASQRMPPDNVQARREGAALYAMQGFRCAIRMRDFPAARKYWALAISTNPESTATYAQVALLSFLQRHYLENKAEVDYLHLPQDIRSTVWDAAERSYSKLGSKLFTMEQIEDAARAGTLDKLISSQNARKNASVPSLSSLYCPAFYPDFDPIADPDYDPRFRILSYPLHSLRSAAERAKQAGETGKE